MGKKFNNRYRLGVGVTALVGLGVALVMPAGVANGGKTAPPVTFTSVELEPLATGYSAYAVAMNNNGDVVGTAGVGKDSNGNTVVAPVLWPAAAANATSWPGVDLTAELAAAAPPPPADANPPTYSGFSLAGINDAGQMAGACQYLTTVTNPDGTTSYYNHYRAFFYDRPNGTFLIAPVPSGWDDMWAGAINQSGIVAGSLSNPYNAVFVWNPATATPPTVIQPSNVELNGATGINDSGDVLCEGGTTGGPRAVLCTPDSNSSTYTYAVIQPLGGSITDWTQASGLNKSGEVAGDSSTNQVAFVAITYTSGVVVNLNTRTMYESRAISVNDPGQVVGWYWGAGSWTNTYGFFLNIPGKGTFQLSQLTTNPPPGMNTPTENAGAVITNPPAGKTYGRIAINASTGIPYILLPQN